MTAKERLEESNKKLTNNNLCIKIELQTSIQRENTTFNRELLYDISKYLNQNNQEKICSGLGDVFFELQKKGELITILDDIIIHFETLREYYS